MKVLVVLSLVLATALAAPSYKKPPFNFCKACVEALTALENHVASQEQLQQELEDLCKKLSGWEEYVCEAAVDAATPEIYKLLHHDIAPQKLCSLIPGQHCASSTPVETQAVMQQPGGFQCPLCEGLISYLKEQLMSVEIEKKLEVYFKEACDQVIPAGQDRQICDNIMDQYFPKIWAKILAFLNDEQICTDLKLCSSATELFASMPDAKQICDACDAAVLEFQDNLPEIEAHLVQFCEDFPFKPFREPCLNEVAKIASSNVSPSQICGQLLPFCPASKIVTQNLESTSQICDACDTIVLEFQDNLPEIEAGLVQFCNAFPYKQFRAPCLNEVAKIANSDVSPSQICGQLLPFCPASKTVEQQQVAAINPAALGCSFCKSVFTWFQAQILTAATEKEILAKIDQVCQEIPNQDYAQKCAATLNKYGDKLFQKVVTILGPSNICQELNACPSS